MTQDPSPGTPVVVHPPCARCKKEKRTGDVLHKPREFCNCWRNTTFDPKYCNEIEERFKNEKEVIFTSTERFRPQKEQITRHYNTYWEKAAEKEMNWGIKSTSPTKILMRLPTFERRAAEKNIPESTFYDRKNRYAQFSESLELCLQIQRAILIEFGLNWIYNSNITALMLKNNHGWSDKSEVNQTIKHDLTELTEKQIEAIEALKNLV